MDTNEGKPLEKRLPNNIIDESFQKGHGTIPDKMMQLKHTGEEHCG